MKMTEKILEAGKSSRGKGFWSKKQFKALGVSFPLVSGWRRRLIGRNVSRSAVAKFLELKDHHLTEAEVARAEARKIKKAKAVKPVKVNPWTKAGMSKHDWKNFQRLERDRERFAAGYGPREPEEMLDPMGMILPFSGIYVAPDNLEPPLDVIYDCPFKINVIKVSIRLDKV